MAAYQLTSYLLSLHCLNRQLRDFPLSCHFPLTTVSSCSLTGRFPSSRHWRLAASTPRRTTLTSKENKTENKPLPDLSPPHFGIRQVRHTNGRKYNHPIELTISGGFAAERSILRRRFTWETTQDRHLLCCTAARVARRTEPQVTLTFNRLSRSTCSKLGRS